MARRHEDELALEISKCGSGQAFDEGLTLPAFALLIDGKQMTRPVKAILGPFGSAWLARSRLSCRPNSPRGASRHQPEKSPPCARAQRERGDRPAVEANDRRGRAGLRPHADGASDLSSMAACGAVGGLRSKRRYDGKFVDGEFVNIGPTYDVRAVGSAPPGFPLAVSNLRSR